jgi:hypothetical protein
MKRRKTREPAQTTTTGDHAFLWVECPDHPWYGVSVMVTRDNAVCVPPLDGTPSHRMELAA